MSIGPFFDRGGKVIDGAQLEVLFRDSSYAQVASSAFRNGAITVTTSWVGHDYLASLPPAIFRTIVEGDGVQVCIRSATEEDALVAHAIVSGRYEEQQAVGTSKILSDGAL